MATTITSECINCGACEPECPNTAIYAGGVGWELNGETHPGISQDIYYIVPGKCTECVGFYDHEACAAVCPVDCCIPDPANLESEAVLIERAKVLHPEQAFGADFPSRFRKEAAASEAPAADGDGAAAKAAGEAPVPAAAAAPAPKPAAAPAPAAAAAAQSDEFDPIAWEVPVRCKDCHEIYAIPYRHFQAGVVFYCPNCSGSFVPNSEIYRTVRDTFENFFGRRQREREALDRKRARELEQFEAKQAAEMEAFQERLKRQADEIKPAGKMVRPKGLASMFT
jgi:ferredoxin